jgi:hypothetical protein
LVTKNDTEYAAPTLPAGSAAGVMVGAGVTVIVNGPALLDPLLSEAITENVMDVALIGVPKRVPSERSEIPFCGSSADVNVIGPPPGAESLAVNFCPCE